LCRIERVSVREIRLAPRSGERPTREARRERGSAARKSLPLSLTLSPLPRGEGIGMWSQ
jgi:hypothetical protein